MKEGQALDKEVCCLSVFQITFNTTFLLRSLWENFLYGCYFVHL